MDILITDAKVETTLWGAFYTWQWLNMDAVQLKLELPDAQQLRFGEEDLLHKIGCIVMYLKSAARSG